ncbi:MAG: hypothetical protein A2268_10000 [Candidatus Raymondbacteria bacterium RifOxyA12_full_50_37]|uniref:Right handed beta helix domain-containing protein n=1 Tax=Candidatus Raymondbacteria bacterium RIFOXYD12_FULL_49_13 TaxID=1817890 RepID=A0A1F7F4F6_UNCRA|nr:MAG: hypothetical protein A2268_10000 [Candidatus Raymondbacteria bacterium RifOxyA12_full_50_37]OGJ93830.1 MAG: hypothetical protein A2248_06300 [Candidatus Raymondbacteria bacterium RIFOXYA2_FULL_49_16]OGJ96529.1 MAG: hypothetical protein A2350_02850 [Candidatus Raymondbacteria bacterium RifOxyB12_full_50_8]OGJ97333.1 MAG: hypothetical protein A2487_16530 [Candidatus Raymondbacteria bacterium RifOxyC12_full_50_8]OGJ98303.1 MAG: hypothetical protein A2453_00875 [Candidatus Raymondbacteria b
MKALYIIGLTGLFFIPIHLSAYTTADGKTVPTLPVPSGTVVRCSTAATFNQAINSATSGRTILLKDGTYLMAGYEPMSLDVANITIRGESGDPTKVLVQGRGFESCTNVDEEMFVLYSGNITLADFTIMESRCHGLKIEHANADNILLHNMRFINIGERMIKGGSAYNPQNWTIRYCHFEDNKVPAADRCGAHDAGNYIAGMDIMNGSGWIVSDSYFKNIKGASAGGRGGIFWWQGNTNMTVERNMFIGCDRSICFGNPSGSNDVDSAIIRNNIINRGAYIGLELCYCSNVKVYNNTIYSSDATYSRTIHLYQNGSGNEIKNTIVYGGVLLNGGIMPDTSHNLRYIVGAFIFQSRALNDFHLLPTATAAINKGMILGASLVDDWDKQTRDSIDATPDIGADEYTPADAIESIVPRSAETSLSVSPNPFNPVLTIHMNSYEPATLRVFDTAGRMVADLTTNLKNGCATWDASALPSGIFVIVSTGNTGASKSVRATLLK